MFFFLSLNLINITHALFFHKQQIPVYSELNLIIASAIAGKVLPLVDLLPLLNVFHGKPPIYANLWKTTIYSLGVYCSAIVISSRHSFSSTRTSASHFGNGYFRRIGTGSMEFNFGCSPCCSSMWLPRKR